MIPNRADYVIHCYFLELARFLPECVANLCARYAQSREIPVRHPNECMSDKPNNRFWAENCLWHLQDIGDELLLARCVCHEQEEEEQEQNSKWIFEVQLKVPLPQATPSGRILWATAQITNRQSTILWVLHSLTLQCIRIELRGEEQAQHQQKQKGGSSTTESRYAILLPDVCLERPLCLETENTKLGFRPYLFGYEENLVFAWNVTREVKGDNGGKGKYKMSYLRCLVYGESGKLLNGFDLPFDGCCVSNISKLQVFHHLHLLVCWARAFRRRRFGCSRRPWEFVCDLRSLFLHSRGQFTLQRSGQWRGDFMGAEMEDGLDWCEMLNASTALYLLPCPLPDIHLLEV